MRIRRQLLLATVLAAFGCGGGSPTTPTELSGLTTGGPQSRPTSGEAFEVTGVVTDADGVPMPGAEVTMAHWLAGRVWRPSVLTDASGGYRISFTANALVRPADRFVARAEVVADGHELYWRSLITTTDSNLVLSFRLYRITRIAAGDSRVVSFPPDVGECPGWVAERCGIARVTLTKPGRLTVEAIPTGLTAETTQLEVCCASGNEHYGNPVTISVAGGTEIEVKVGLPRGLATTQSFVLKTSLDPS